MSDTKSKQWLQVLTQSTFSTLLMSLTELQTYKVGGVAQW